MLPIRSLVIKRDTIRLLRIPFSLFLMPVFLLALSQAPGVDLLAAVWSFVILHLLVYPASNGYNSYIDKDESSIGGLENPPQPGPELFYTTLILDLAAVLISALVLNILFACCILLYISASRAYSSRAIRLKKYPFTGFLVVAFFQGAFAYYMSYAGMTGRPMPLSNTGLFILLACSLQIAGAYPLTQIYQHAEDKAAGDLTLSRKLGIRGTFLFTAAMFVLCNVFYYFYFVTLGRFSHFLWLQLFFLPLVSYFVYWFARVLKDETQANYRNTMRMNLVASACSAACFVFLFFLKP